MNDLSKVQKNHRKYLLTGVCEIRLTPRRDKVAVMGKRVRLRVFSFPFPCPPQRQGGLSPVPPSPSCSSPRWARGSQVTLQVGGLNLHLFYYD